jgi:hypothetical protein
LAFKSAAIAALFDDEEEKEEEEEEEEGAEEEQEEDGFVHVDAANVKRAMAPPPPLPNIELLSKMELRATVMEATGAVVTALKKRVAVEHSFWQDVYGAYSHPEEAKRKVRRCIACLWASLSLWG